MTSAFWRNHYNKRLIQLYILSLFNNEETETFNIVNEKWLEVRSIFPVCHSVKKISCKSQYSFNLASPQKLCYPGLF